MMIAEKEASNLPKGSIFFASHPTSQERRDTLTKMAAEYDSDTAKLGRERFVEMTARYRGDWLRDELRQRDFGSLQVVLDHLMEAGANPGELHYFQGELYRLRGEEKEEDTEKAVEAYKKAIEFVGAPGEVHRALGLVYLSTDRADEAKSAFEAYLVAAPEAEDRAMIEHYLQQIE
jgi:tetratricopeptide (TPR) repeat protein